MTDPLTTLRDTARAHARAAGVADQTRAARDAAIRSAATAGMGIRLIARETGLDPSLISRIVRR